MEAEGSTLYAAAGLTDVSSASDRQHQEHHEQSDLEVTYCHIVVEYSEHCCAMLGLSHAG